MPRAKKKRNGPPEHRPCNLRRYTVTEASLASGRCLEDRMNGKEWLPGCLAQELGVQTKFISYMKNGLVRPTLFQCQMLVELLGGVPSDYTGGVPLSELPKFPCDQETEDLYERRSTPIGDLIVDGAKRWNIRHKQRTYMKLALALCTRTGRVWAWGNGDIIPDAEQAKRLASVLGGDPGDYLPSPLGEQSEDGKQDC